MPKGYRTNHSVNSGSFGRGHLGMINENHPSWKGDNVGINCLHKWIRRHKPKPELCEECHQQPPLDVANISGKYLRDINDFRWLCRKCHLLSDGRIKNLKHQEVD
jgi:hypothetical protein